MDTKATFAERAKLLKETAQRLRQAAEIVLAEVQHMEAAQTRFAQKVAARKDKKSAA